MINRNNYIQNSLLLSLLIACRTDEKIPTTEPSMEETVDTGSTEDTSEENTDTATTDTAEETDTSEEIDTGLACEEQLETALEWFSETEITEMPGELSFAQTHVISEEETRWAPSIVTNRAMLVLFAPTEELSSDTELRISAWKNGELLGVMELSSPENQPAILEQQLTIENLEAWSTTDWSAFIPYHWVESGVELRIGYAAEQVLHQRDFVLENLAAPHEFSIHRSKIVLFGEEAFDTTTVNPSQLSQDFFATLPFSQLNWVDSTPWVLDEIVVNGENGPVLVSSEGERVSLTTDPDRWNILKQIFTRRISLANIGKGSHNTNFGADNSPYSFGTTVGLGWVKNDNGNYVDINNAPYSAGWTGWTSIWHGECGNVFNHEVGHSMTLLHFTSGSANNWGIGDQYPNDGENVAAHPWGFDTTRNLFRTWYRVNSEGIVYKEDGAIQGKRDSMNGGEAANAITCFPQYTAYHAWKIQNWAQTTPQFREENGTTGLFLWNVENQAYEAVEPDGYQPELLAMDVPTATIVGSLGFNADANHIYPALYWSSNNQFAFPDPNDPSLEEYFTGANYFARVSYQDGTHNDLLLNHPTITDDTHALFSFNIDLRKDPTTIALFHSEASYPNIDINNATLLYTRNLTVPTQLPSKIRTGTGSLSNGKLLLTERCETGINCDERSVQSVWRNGEAEMWFQATEDAEPVFCSEEGAYSSFVVAVENENGEQAELTIFAQKILATGTGTSHYPLNDQTAWSADIHREQGITLWIPYPENSNLLAGNWSGQDVIIAHVGEEQIEIPLEIDLEVLESELIDISTTFESDPIYVEDSSLYFLMTDPNIGPTSRVWWGSSDPTSLSIPMIDQQTGSVVSLSLNAWKKTCNLGWGPLWSLNSGQVAASCDSQVLLELPVTGNEHLESGHSYQSPASQPIIFEGRYWHGEMARQLAGRFIYQMEITWP